MKIHIIEFKKKLLTNINNLIDTYFSSNEIKERFMGATAKIIVNQNIDKLDDFIVLFTDKDGTIDTDVLLREYGKAFGTDKLIIDLRDFVSNDMIKQLLPNRAIALQLEDIAKIFEES
jgi:hypothetical protein